VEIKGKGGEVWTNVIPLYASSGMGTGEIPAGLGSDFLVGGREVLILVLGPDVDHTNSVSVSLIPQNRTPCTIYILLIHILFCHS